MVENSGEEAILTLIAVVEWDAPKEGGTSRGYGKAGGSKMGVIGSPIGLWGALQESEIISLHISTHGCSVLLGSDPGCGLPNRHT